MTLPHRTAREALDRIPAGALVVSAPGMGAPGSLLAELTVVAPGRGWTLVSGLLMDYPFLPLVEEGALGYRTWHVMAPVRDLVADGRAGFVPARASRLAALLERWQVDAALVRVTPPDELGMCSLGPSVSYGMAAVASARIVIAEVDPTLPRTHGDSSVHVSCFDSLVETASAVPEYRSAKPNPTSTAIAERVLDLLPAEPTLQIGIGAIPETLVRSLPSRDLGSVRFVGMATDEMVDLFETGLLRRDAVVPRPAILSPDMMGTARLLAFSHDNPSVGMYPSAVSHDPAYLAGAYDRFVSVNTAIEIDLEGNVNSETVNGKQISGAGGSLDYVDTATRSRGGLRVIALPASSADARVTRIVPKVATVTVPRTMVDVVVTEHGVARLDGLTTRERTEALVALAHPDHRDALRAAADETLAGATA